MLKLKSFWHGGIVVLAFMLIASSVGIQFAQDQRVGAQTGTCGTDAVFLTPNPGDIVDGITQVRMYVAPAIQGTVVNASKVNFFVDNAFVGPSVEQSGNWVSDWDTTLTANGPAVLTAKVYDNTNMVICTSDPLGVHIDNLATTTTGDFTLQRVDPTTDPWVTPTNLSNLFKVTARFSSTDSGTNGDVSSDTLFNWRLGAGSVGFLDGPTDQKAVDYFSGPLLGTATIIVDAEYAGYTDTRVFNVVIEESASTNYPALTEEEAATTTVTDDGSATTVTDDTQISSEDLNAQLTSDPVLTDCLVDVVGEDGYQDVVDGVRRLTFEELDAAYLCFANTRYLLPANVAPISPVQLRELREDRRAARIDSVEQADPEDNGKDRLVFRGVSLPNSTIVLYIFSEPLVLTTTTDGEGNWTYVLEDPLAPGEHEVFVAVEDDSGDPVRSSAFTFNVAQAASIDTNPSGLSLTLDLTNPQSNSTIYYVSAVGAVLLVSLGLYIFVVRRKTKELDTDVAEGETGTKS